MAARRQVYTPQCTPPPISAQEELVYVTYQMYEIVRDLLYSEIRRDRAEIYSDHQGSERPSYTSYSYKLQVKIVQICKLQVTICRGVDDLWDYATEIALVGGIMINRDVRPAAARA